MNEVATITNKMSNLTSSGGSQLNRIGKVKTLANDLEASFISEFLNHTLPKNSTSFFGGGSGEDQFSSFLNEAYAQEIVKSGGFGLSEKFEQQLSETLYDKE